MPRKRGALQALPLLASSIKPPLTMEDWDSKAPLPEIAAQSIAALKKACEQRPMPLKVRSYRYAIMLVS